MYRAFVSSTFEDLKAHRQYVISKLRQAGFAVDPMEDWTASTDEPKVFSQNRIDGCDLCVLLVAFRRGYVPPGAELSITQLEYRTAAAKEGVDPLVFMLEEDAPWPRQFDELDTEAGIREWRRELTRDRGVGFFGQDPASINIGPALARWVTERQKGASRTSEPSIATEYLRTPWLGIEFLQQDRLCTMLGSESGELGVDEVIEIRLEPGPFELRVPNVGDRDLVIVKAWTDDSIYQGFESQAMKKDLPFMDNGWGMADTTFGSGQLFLEPIAYHTFGKGFRADVNAEAKLRILFKKIRSGASDKSETAEIPPRVYMVVFIDRNDQAVLERDTFEKLVLTIEPIAGTGS